MRKNCSAVMMRYCFFLIFSLILHCKGEKRGQKEVVAIKSVQDIGTQEEEKEMEGEKKLKIAYDIEKRLAQFVPTKIGISEDKIPEELKPLIKKLIEASQIIDEIYLLQVSEKNIELKEILQSSPDYKLALDYFNIMYGPWDRINHNEPFIGDIKKPLGASFYPEDMTKEEFSNFIKKNPEKKEIFESYFTVIRRGKDGELIAIPYSEYYKERLERAASILEEAASLTQISSLKNYLTLRAKAFRTNDYFESDIAWMELGDSPIEVVIGPYEVYEDMLMGLKASFEAFVCLRLKEDSEKLKVLESYIKELEDNIPLSKEIKARSEPKGMESPISVVVELFTAGDTRAGVQTVAFNLPNDEMVRKEKGSKKVMLKNVIEAKFNGILYPIAQLLLAPEILKELSFEAFFNNILMHEIAHGLGPGIITLEDGTKSDVNKILKEYYPAIEEAKADILGLWASKYLIDRGKLPKRLEKQIYVAFLAGFFRSVRFGAKEAHGKANLIQFNYLKENKAIVEIQDGRFDIDFSKVSQAVESLAKLLLEIEGKGDYNGAKTLLEKYGEIDESLRKAIEKIKEVPIDIKPEYTIVEMIKNWK